MRNTISITAIVNEMKSQPTNMSNLKQDLSIAWEYGTAYERSTGSYINSIDPCNMVLLRDLWQSVCGSYSLATLAGGLLKGNKLKY